MNETTLNQTGITSTVTAFSPTMNESTNNKTGITPTVTASFTSAELIRQPLIMYGGVYLPRVSLKQQAPYGRRNESTAND
jgi:hypothetical protein